MNEYPPIDLSEYEIQTRLYYHLIKEFEKINDKDIWRIRLEHKPYKGKLKNKAKNWKKCYKEYCEHKIYEIDCDGKEGVYDLVIFDKKNKEILHAIEIKKITSEDHRGFEDLYVLSDFLKSKNTKNQGYIFLFTIVNSEGKKKERKQYLDNIKETYEKADVVCRYNILKQFK